MKIKMCRVCGTELMILFSLGKIPIVNYYLSEEERNKPEKKYPLTLCLCKNCGLVQLNYLIRPKKLFTTYHYASSVSSPLKDHLEKLAQLCKKKFKLTKNSRVVDIGCNDGVLLSKLKESGIQTLGIDPAKNIVDKLKTLQIPVIPDFFTEKLAEKLAKKEKFDFIVATNTLAQVDNINGFVRGLKKTLKKEGVFVAEIGYVLDMIQKKTFDSIYHEHFSYFSLHALQYLFEKHNLSIFDAQRISNHGGSLRIFVRHTENHKRKTTTRFVQLLHHEKTFHLQTPEAYKDFISYCKTFKKQFKTALSRLKKKDKIIVGVGSPAKSVVVLNFCRIGSSILDYIIDSTPYKQYRFMPGTHIPIFPEDYLKKSKQPDYFLLLAWTYKNTLLKKIQPYRKEKSKIIIPFPDIRIQ